MYCLRDKDGKLDFDPAVQVYDYTYTRTPDKMAAF